MGLLGRDIRVRHTGNVHFACSGDDAQAAALQAESSAARYEEYQSTMALDERNAACAKSAHDVADLASAQAAADVRVHESNRRCADLEREKQDRTGEQNLAVLRADANQYFIGIGVNLGQFGNPRPA